MIPQLYIFKTHRLGELAIAHFWRMTLLGIACLVLCMAVACVADADIRRLDEEFGVEKVGERKNIVTERFPHDMCSHVPYIFI